MRKQFLLFMALFALGGLNNLFASGEASNHLTDGTLNPTGMNLTAISLPASISSITAANYASTVWAPAKYNSIDLVTWSSDDGAIKFAGLEALGKNDNDAEHPFIIRLAGAGKKLTIQTNKAASTEEPNTGAKFKIYEWDGTKWVLNKDQNNYTTNAVDANNLKASTRYVMIAPYGHGGGDRILSKLDITKGDAGLSADKSALAFPTNNPTAQIVTVLNAYTGVHPSASWKAGSTDKFTFTPSQTGTADDGQTVYTITPKSGAVAGDNDVLVVTAGGMAVEIPVVVYDATDKSLPINLTSGGSVADAARFIGMCTHNKTSYDFATKSITFFGGQSYATDVRSVTFQISDAPSALSYTIQAAQEGAYYNATKPKITTFQSTDGSTWTQAGELKDFNGTENVNLELMSTTRYIKLEFSEIKGVGTLTNLKITKADPVPTKVWNIGTTLFERNDYSDIFKTNSDAQLTITVNSPNSLISYANGKLTTAAIASSPQSAGSITVSAPATATFQAFETTLENIQLVSNPAYLPAIVNSKDVFDLLFSGQSSQDVSPNAQWNNDEGAIELLRRSTGSDRYFELTIKGVPYQLSFDYKNDESSDWGGNIEMWIKESVDGTTWTDVKTGIKPSNLSEYTPFGPYDLSSTTTKIRVYVKGTYAQHLFKNLTIISASPMLNVAESVVELKANATQVFDNIVNFSVLKYQTITAKIEGAGFGLVKGDDAAASEITFTDADGLNNSTFQDCTFKVRYSSDDASGAVGKKATIKFYGDKNMDAEIGSVAVSVIAMPRLTFEVPTNGSYTYQYQGESAITVNEQKTRELADAPYEVTLTADANVQGYKFMGWYEKNGENKTYLSNTSTFVTSIETTKTIGAEFVSSTTPIFIIKGQSVPYTDLNTACVAANGSGIVVLISDGTLPAGNYTVPEGVTLLVPFDNAYTCYTDMPGAWHGHYNPNTGQYSRDYSNDSRDDNSKEYVVLTLAEGASLNVDGVLSLSADRWCIYNTGNHGASIPNISGNFRLDKKYGLIDMQSGSSIKVGNTSTKPNAKLYCWGRIRGEGTITAEENAEVRESLVFTDWRESDSLGWYAQNSKCFPFTQYYVQDIQVPITFNYGSKEVLVTGLFGVSTQAVGKGTMQLVGPNNSESLITIPQNGKFIKRYDIPTDRLIFDFYDGVSFNAAKLKVSVSGINMDAPTSTHIFPITNNWTINYHPSSTPYTIKYDLALCAGAIMNIETGAHLQLLAGASLYVYDKEDWDKFASRNYIIPLFLPKYEREHGSYDGISTTTFTAGYGNYTVLTSRLFENLQDASIKVNGKFTVFGEENNIYKGTSYGQAISPRSNSGLYTTAGGANIYSDGGGQIIYKKGSGDQEITPQVYLAGRTIKKVPISPARLFNKNSNYVSTSDYSTSAEVTFYNKDGYWYEEDKSASTVTINSENIQFDDADPEDIDNSTYTVENAQMVEAETVTVNNGSTLNVEDGGAVVATTLVLNASPSALDIDNGTAGTSSQVKGTGSINAANVYIDITMDPQGTLDASKYYAFAVPFAVNVADGVQMFKNNVWVACTHNTNYRAYTYNGANRAANGKGSNWELVANNGTFQPGVFYLVEFADASANVFRFSKATGEDLNNAANIALQEYGNGTQNSPDAGWNGIANNSLQNASISLSSTGVAQIFDPIQSKFITVDLGNTVFAIGTPLFIQASGDGVTATNSAVQASPSSPARMLAQTDDETFGNYTIRIKADGATKMADQMFISASENASANYVIGKDLVKMFMGNATVAQLWVNDYGKKLSANQAVLTNDVAVASLTLYAPAAGNYTIYLKDIPEDATIYLLQNGQAIANLNDGAFTVSLAKGENTLYGLRINAIRTLPGVVTSIDEALIKGDLQKVLLNGVVYIVRDGKLFNVLGQQR